MQSTKTLFLASFFGVQIVVFLDQLLNPDGATLATLHSWEEFQWNNFNFKHLKFSLILLIIPIIFTSCDAAPGNQKAEMEMTEKMHQKVQKIATELKKHCDSELIRKAKDSADKFLQKK